MMQALLKLAVQIRSKNLRKNYMSFKVDFLNKIVIPKIVIPREDARSLRALAAHAP